MRRSRKRKREEGSRRKELKTGGCEKRCKDGKKEEERRKR